MPKFFLTLILIFSFISCEQIMTQDLEEDAVIDSNEIKIDNDEIDIEEEVAFNSNVILQAKIFLQGFYDRHSREMTNYLNEKELIPLLQPYKEIHNYPGEEKVSEKFLVKNPEIVDWLLIEVRTKLSKKSVVARRAVLIDQAGHLRELDGTKQIKLKIPEGKYYLVFKHRNHLNVMGQEMVNLTRFISRSGYDYTSEAESVLPCSDDSDSLQKIDDNTFGMIVGDVNQDGRICYTGSCGGYGSQTDHNILMSYILNHPLNVFEALNFPVTGVYSPLDLNIDAIVRYSGDENDLNVLKDVILAHPANAFSLLTYSIVQNENI